MAPIEEKIRKPPVQWESVRDETAKEKLLRKVKGNPFIPIGCLLTVGALGYGLFSFLRGNTKMQQQMMRARVLAQGSTLIAVIAGLGYELYLDSKQSEKK
ncbi:hypothetical protein QZH41_009515 [Actinostola sp. cb2023]|nr:hypothetical protein QZH41_009515 [Actinostola sp. cb2023]